MSDSLYDDIMKYAKEAEKEQKRSDEFVEKLKNYLLSNDIQRLGPINNHTTAKEVAILLNKFFENNK